MEMLVFAGGTIFGAILGAMGMFFMIKETRLDLMIAEENEKIREVYVDDSNIYPPIPDLDADDLDFPNSRR